MAQQNVGFGDVTDTVYPRVRVREQEDTISIQEETTSYLRRVIESVSIEGHCSSRILSTGKDGNECKSNPPQLQAKISMSYPMNSFSTSDPTSKGKINKCVDEDNIIKIGPSSAPRPRAVLSSPDNDEIIGNQNRLNKKKATVREMRNQKQHTLDAIRITGKQNQLIRESGTPSKSRPLSRNRHAQVEVSTANARPSAPHRTREITIQGFKNTHLEGKHESNLSKSCLRPSIKRG